MNYEFFRNLPAEKAAALVPGGKVEDGQAITVAPHRQAMVTLPAYLVRRLLLQFFAGDSIPLKELHATMSLAAMNKPNLVSDLVALYNAQMVDGKEKKWHIHGLGEVSNEDHTQSIVCTEFDPSTNGLTGVVVGETINDKLAEKVCALLNMADNKEDPQAAGDWVRRNVSGPASLVQAMVNHSQGAEHDDHN